MSYDLEPGPATGSLALPDAREGLPHPPTPGLAGGWGLDFDPPSPLRVTVFFWLELDCFALQMPLSRRLLPSLKERSSVKFSFVFFPILKSQPSSLLLRAATARHPPLPGSHRPGV